MRRKFIPGKRKFAEYPLRHKVFFGCCRHAMIRTKTKYPHFYYRYTAVDKDAACEGGFEKMLYKIMSEQAQIILNLDDLSHVKPENIRSAKQSDCCKRMDALLDRKCALYEQLPGRVITVADYQAKKYKINCELDGLKQVQTMLTAETGQKQASRQARTVRQGAAHEIVRAPMA